MTTTTHQITVTVCVRDEHGDEYHPTCVCGQWNIDTPERIARGLGAMRFHDKDTAQSYGEAHLNWIIRNCNEIAITADCPEIGNEDRG